MTDVTELFGNDDNLEPDIPEENILETLVGEGRKYKSIEDLAKSVIYKDLHIKKIETENASYRTNQVAAQRLEELVSKLSTPTPSSAPNLERREPEEPNKPSLTAESVEQIIERRDAKKRGDANLALVKEKLSEAYGSNWQQTLRQKAAQLDLTEQEVFAIARDKPKVLFESLGIGRVQPQYAPEVPSNKMAPEALRLSPGQKEDWNYYETLRKTDPKKYNSKPVQDRLLAKILADPSFLPPL